MFPVIRHTISLTPCSGDPRKPLTTVKVAPADAVNREPCLVGADDAGFLVWDMSVNYLNLAIQTSSEIEQIKARSK